MADAFQPKFVDLVRNYTTTTGTGSFTLGPAVNGYSGFASALQPGESFYYSAIGVDKPAEREVGRGTLQANGIVTREPISGAKTNFTTGTKTLALIAAAEWFNTIQAGGGAAGPVPLIAPDRAALAGATSRQVPALMTEAGREGLFVWDARDLSGAVTADMRQGVHVAPASDASGASGAWVRKFDGPVNAQWFGALGDANATGSGGSDDTAALQRAIDYLAHAGGGCLYLPRGHYRCAGGLNLDGLKNIVISGPAGTGAGYAAPPAAQLIFTGTGSGRFLSARSSLAITLRDLGIRYSSASYTGDLVDLSFVTSDAAYGLIERCLVGGINVATARSCINLEGAILCSIVDNHICWATVGVRGAKEVAVGNVVYSNAHTITRCTFDNLTTSAIINAGEGWTVQACWFEGTNGGSGGMPRAYFDTISAASASIASGLTWIGNWHGDAVNVTDAWFCNGSRTMRGLTIQGGTFDTAGSAVAGVKLTASCEGLSIGGASFSSTVDLANRAHYGVNISGNFLGTEVANISPNVADLWIAGNKVEGSFANSYLRISKPQEWRMGAGGGPGGPGVYQACAPAATDVSFVLDRENQRYGSMEFRTGGAKRWLFGVTNENEYGGAGGTNFWIIRYDNAGGFLGSAMTIERSTGNVTFGGTVTAPALSAGAVTSTGGPLGYAPGAGGAVTQATSKSTGVTINKPAGQITTHGESMAAGAVVSFAVTNSTVAATDTVNLNLASGNAAAGSYRYWVEGVAAGAFEVVVENRSAGALAEALVFNFAVVKAVSA